jgi:hypothetical protein
VCRWKDTVKADFIEIIWEGLNWVCLAQNTEPWWSCVNTLMHLTYHKKADIFCAAIVSIVIIIFTARFIHFKVKTYRVFESCKHIIVVFLKDVEKKPV